ncbi:unnamed protein product, partial [Leptidea sinapis]
AVGSSNHHSCAQTTYLSGSIAKSYAIKSFTFLRFNTSFNMSVLKSIAVFLLVVMANNVRGQIILPGGCPDVTAMSDFVPGRYLGKWYEAEKYFAIFEMGGKCITATYSAEDDGVIGVKNQQISTYTGMKSEIVGEATQESRDAGKLVVRFPSLPVNVPAPYWVVDTDYDNYALVWGCLDLGIMHTENAWILTRARHPQLSVLEAAYAAADRNNIKRSYFMRTEQSDCPNN